MTPQERARHARHEAVTKRATTLLKNDSTKLKTFRDHVSSYKSGKTSPPDLIDAFFSLFDCSSSDLGKLIRELADLYEDDSKRQALLEAWNSWRSINEDYPSLPGPSGTLPGMPSSSNPGSYSSAINSHTSANLAATLGANVSSGRRVLKLKSSTAQSRNAATSGAAARALNNPEAFPALSSARSQRPQGHAQPMWSGSQPQATSTHLSIQPQPQPRPTPQVANQSNKASLPPTMSQRRNDSLFPSLPKAAKPNVMISGFNTRGSGRLTSSGQNSGASTPRTTPWGASPTPGEAQAALNAVAAQGDGESHIQSQSDGAGKGKKVQGKNKKGQTLNLREYLS